MLYVYHLKLFFIVTSFLVYKASVASILDILYFKLSIGKYTKMLFKVCVVVCALLCGAQVRECLFFGVLSIVNE